ncbi:Zn-dependent oxidoreductase [Aurantimonas sp. VKM B-3413]|uniref:Zn-dependent oxidoreductase n=1 Tax=Aurantimonas sp. VKM B-3413 TaxID=2779401 RepID=UPI001E2CEA2C|nr:Zn-dependent oxidoreductase [Aurantimonas sp. VKM B-3413]MCB8839968.1 Zn-dependent oxidoreductase [Aurantimonas sp. VKM B-3413]
MLAISVPEPHLVEVLEREVPRPAAGQVLMRVVRGGICGSDIHIFHGSNPFARYPRVIGHEFAGVVEAVGDGVEDFEAGDRVVADPVIACGHCYPCRVGRPNVCANLEVMGVHRDGGFQQLVCVPATNAVKIPDRLSLAIAALAEPFSIAANVLSRTACGPEDTVLIYGAGTVGLTVLQVAKLKGARTVIADPDIKRLERAEGFGADRLLISGQDDIPASVAGETDGLGPTVVIDGAGVPRLLDEACRIASPAGRIGILGFSPAPSNVSQQEIVRKELTLVGSRLSRRLLPEVLSWLGDGRLKPGAMITQTFRASEVADALRLIENSPDQTIKVQLDFQE